MLTSLQHPYINYMIAKNNDDLINAADGSVTPKNSGIYGLRAGIRMESGQAYYANQRVAYSQFEGNDFEWMPIYAMKWAEVDFLRAEGALRGWSMGGTAQSFYERGIKNADCGDRFGMRQATTRHILTTTCKSRTPYLSPTSTRWITTTTSKA